MLLNEFMEGVSSDNKLFELDMMKITAYTERAEREYEINLKQADLKVMTESGTCDDLEYLYEAAGDSLGGKIAKAMKKIKESVAKFFKGIKDKIASLLGSKKTQSGIASLENKLRGSKAGNAKMKIFDINKRKKVHQRTKAKLKKELVLAKNGKSSKERIDAILREHKKAIAAIPLATVTVLAGLKLFKAKAKKSVGEITTIENECMSVFDRVGPVDFKGAADSLGTEVKNQMAKSSTLEMACIRGLAEVSKEEAKDESSFLVNVMGNARSAISAMSKNLTKNGRMENKAAKIQEQEQNYNDLKAAAERGRSGKINIKAFESADDLLDEELLTEFSIFDDYNDYEDMYTESSFDSDDDIFGESDDNDEDDMFDMFEESADDFDTLYENFAREEHDNIEDAINDLF